MYIYSHLESKIVPGGINTSDKDNTTLPAIVICRPLLDAHDVAAVAALPYERVLALIRSGTIRAGRIGGQYRIDPAELDRFLTERGLPGVVQILEQI